MNGLFIVGMWNCGTTLLCEIFKHHQYIEMLGIPSQQANYEEQETEIPFSLWKGHGFLNPNFLLELTNGQVFKYFCNTINDDSASIFFQSFHHRFLMKDECNHLLIKNNNLIFYRELINTVFKGHNITKVLILRDRKHQCLSKGYWDGDVKLLEDRVKIWKMVDPFIVGWKKDKNTVIVTYEELCDKPKQTIEKICNAAGINFNMIVDWIQNEYTQSTNNYKNLDSVNKRYLDMLLK